MYGIRPRRRRLSGRNKAQFDTPKEDNNPNKKKEKKRPNLAPLAGMGKRIRGVAIIPDQKRAARGVCLARFALSLSPECVIGREEGGGGIAS